MESRRRLAEFLADRPERGQGALLVYLVSAIAVLGVSFISPVLPAIMEGLSLTEAQSGLIITVYTAPVIVFVPVFGWISDRIGRRPIITFGLVVFGVAGTAIFFSTTFWTIITLRIVQGIGFSAMMPLTTALLGDLFQGDAEVGAQGLRVTFISLGSAIYPVLGGHLAEMDWRLPFLLFAVAIPLGLVAFAALPDETSGQSDEGVSETGNEPRDREGSYVSAVFTGARDPLVASALGVGFVRFFVRYGLWAYLPLLATQRSLTSSQIGLVIGIVGATKMVLASQSRRVLTIGAPSVLMAGGLFGGSVLAAGMSLPTTLAPYLILGACFGVVDGIVAPLQKSLVTQRVSADVRGGVVSANTVIQNTGKTLGPAALGLLTGVMELSKMLLILGAGGAVAGVLALAAVQWHRTSSVDPGPDLKRG